MAIDVPSFKILQPGDWKEEESFCYELDEEYWYVTPFPYKAFNGKPGQLVFNRNKQRLLQDHVNKRIMCGLFPGWQCDGDSDPTGPDHVMSLVAFFEHDADYRSIRTLPWLYKYKVKADTAFRRAMIEAGRSKIWAWKKWIGLVAIDGFIIDKFFGGSAARPKK